MLASGGIEERNWTEPPSPAVSHLAARCRLVALDDATHPARQPVRLTLRLRDGGVRNAAIPDVRSMSEEEIMARFLAVGEAVLGRARAERLLVDILRLEEIADVSEITPLVSAI